MNQRTLSLFYLWLWSILSILSVSSLDCSSYRDNEDVFNALPFPIQVDPFSHTPTRPYSRTTNGHLSLYFTDVESIPSILFCLTNVTHLEVISSSFEEPNEFSSNIVRFAPTLTSLTILHTKIGQLNSKIGRLVHLVSLILVDADLRFIPSAIIRLQSLVVLNLAENHLTSLPRWMNRMLSLHHLNVADNTNLTSVQSINGHPSLEHLEASRCQLNAPPQDLPQLNYLRMSNNRVKSLRGIETLGYKSKREKQFYFGFNQIGKIPSEIIHIPNLVRLNVNDNCLVNVPNQLVQLVSLKELNVKNNSISMSEINAMKIKFNRTHPHGVTIKY